jgi:hypothetical protein
MTSADLDHNDELLAARKNRKLDWVTPRLTLMGAEDTKSKNNTNVETNVTDPNNGPS